MQRADALDRIAAARVARLATVRPDGMPHLVPITFALVDSEIVSVVDGKPKTTSRLQRLANIDATPAAAVLVDHWAEAWEELWWVRVDGAARILDPPPTSWADTLRAKYANYEEVALDGPGIGVALDRLTWWAHG